MRILARWLQINQANVLASCIPLHVRVEPFSVSVCRLALGGHADGGSSASQKGLQQKIIAQSRELDKLKELLGSHNIDVPADPEPKGKGGHGCGRVRG